MVLWQLVAAVICRDCGAELWRQRLHSLRALKDRLSGLLWSKVADRPLLSIT